MVPEILRSFIDTAAQSGVSLLASFGAAIYDTWVEALVIAAALHVYLILSRSSSPLLLRQFCAPTKPKKAACVPPSPHSPSGCCGTPKVAERRQPFIPRGTQGQPDRAMEVQRLVVSILRKGGAGGWEVLDQYDGLVRGQHVDLRQHITDEQNARSLYTSLVECGVRVAASRGDSAKATTCRLLADMRAFSFPRSHEFYATALKLHVSHRLLEDALWLYDVMVADGVTPDRTMYICLMSVAITQNYDQKAICFFKEIAKAGPPSMRTYMTVLRVFAKSQDWRGAVDLLDGLRNWGACPDALVLNTVLGLCVSASETRAAEALLRQWEECADAVSCNILLKGYAQQANLHKAEVLLARMLTKGPVPNIITFNTIMDCAVRALQAQAQLDKHSHSRHSPEDGGGADGASGALAQRPWQLLDQLTALGLEPDRYTCSTLVKGMHLAGCSASDVDRAVALLHGIGPEGLHAPGAGGGANFNEACNARLLEVLFNTLLDACVSIRDLDRMAEIFKMMEGFKVDVSAVTFGTLIKAFGQAGQLSHCHEVWRNMREAKVVPTIVTFGCYIDACIRNSDIAAAEHIFLSMAQAGVKPNAVIYTSLIRGCAHAKQPLKALELYKEMRESGIEATTVTFNSVLDIIARQLADPARLQEVVDDMHRAAISPDVVTYSILIKASCNAGHVGSAISLFRQLRSHGLAFDEVAFNTLLLACSKAEQISDAEEIFGEMRALGMSPTHVTTSILVKMYGKAKMLDKAIEVSRMVEREYGIMPNLYVYTCLIQACVRNKQVRKSWEVFGRMLQAGVLPDAITYGTLIHGCIYHNRFDQAMALVRHAYMCPAAAGRGLLQGLEQELPPVAASAERDRPVPLQPDVLRALQGALRRKGQSALVAELESVVAEHSKAAAAAGWPSAPAPTSAYGDRRRASADVPAFGYA